MTTGNVSPSDSETLLATPELSRFIAEQLDNAVVSATATLADVRAMLLGNDMFMSGEGEILYKTDRTSLLIELDGLIERHGIDTPVRNVLTIP